MGLGRQDFSGKMLAPQEADAVIADLLPVRDVDDNHPALG